jgi:iron complex transport system substrate-binding protein
MGRMGDGPRIVSLIASATEIVCALGLEKNLVGRSHECDWPPGIERLPVVTHAKVDATASSAEIHRQVTAAYNRDDAGAAQALSIYSVDAQLLESLGADLIITQSQCEVCAVSLGDVERALCRMVSSRPRVVSLEPHRLEDLWQDILKVGRAAAVEAPAAQLVERLQARLRALEQRTRALPQVTAVCIEWIEPLMVAGNWVPQLVQIAGGRDVLGRAGEHAPWIEWDQFHEADPQVIVLMPCGFGLHKTVDESQRLFKHPGFRNYRAVREGRVYAVDGNSYFNRPGPRLVESAQILAEIFHGAAAGSHVPAIAWQKLPPAA